MIRQQKRKAVLARYLQQEFVHVKINIFTCNFGFDLDKYIVR